MGECNEVFFHRNSKDTEKFWGMGEVEGGDPEGNETKDMVIIV